MNDLPKFRRLEDVQRFLQDMHKEVNVTDQLVDQQQSMLAKLRNPKDKVREILAVSFTEFDVTPSGPAKKKSADKSVVAPEINKVVIPNLSKLKDQYGLMEDLYAKRVTLESVETQIEMQFPDLRGPLYDQVVGSLNELKAKVEEQLHKVFTFLSEVAEKHVPKVFKTYTEAVQEAVSNHVSFEDSARYLYVSVKDKKLAFTEYMLLINSVNEDGKVAPHLYIVVQWTVGGKCEVFVEHEFTPPNQLERGAKANTANEALEAITHLLDLEGFAAAIGNAPLSLHLKVNPNKLEPSMFNARDSISKILVSDAGDQLTFTFRAGLSAEQKKQVAYQIFQDMKVHLRNRKPKLRMKISNSKVDIFIADLAQGREISTNDVEFLKDRFGLSDSAVSKIAEIIDRDQHKDD